MKQIISLLLNNKCYNETLNMYLKGYPIADLSAIIDAKANASRIETVVNVINHYGGTVDFYDLLTNYKILLKPLIAIAEKHMREGTRPDYLLSAFKTANNCYEIMLADSDINIRECIEFMINSRRIYDVFEIISVGRWFVNTVENHNTVHKKHKLAMRQLITRYTALLNQFEYPVIITDTAGTITEINQCAQQYFAVSENPHKMHIFAMLDYHYISFEDFLSTYEFNPSKNLRFFNGDRFTSKLTKLSKSAYMFSLIPFSTELALNTPDENTHRLTQTELLVYNRVNSGMTSKQIADELGVTEDTIKTHRRNMRKKLGLSKSSPDSPI